MYPLSESWYLEGRPDLERKRYLLMAYLHSIRTDLEQLQVAPAYLDIARRMVLWNQVVAGLKQQQDLLGRRILNMEGHFNLAIPQVHTPEDASVTHVLEILEDAIRLGQQYLALGHNCYEDIKQGIHIEPVGLYPLNTAEGYWVVHARNSRAYSVFQYRIGPHLPVPVLHRWISVTPLTGWETSLVETDAQIMRRLRCPEWPNPAVFRVELETPLHQEYTVIPILQIYFASGDAA